ncbi:MULTISPECIES: hypothetical protein [Pseudomonas]|uniref:hypothetical protein n=1 Tax=Pseudomonas TaxID=286 RepID=UPI0007C75DF5|nr:MULTISPECIES: hypothetical protein [Pseudomonas]GLO46394.1 hypothetical protein PPUN109347_29570 [Pseudomonas putida]HDS0980528.1 hypothetical protein [Pseudomonas putida]
MNSSTKQSLEQFLKELAKTRKNFGYPIIVAFDRKTANHILKQEFIERYSGGLFLDPINSEIDIDGTSFHQLLDFCLDEPRLSFENADLSDSRAKLLMRSVRGKQIQLTEPLGARRRVTRLAEATPVYGPSLVFDVDLKRDKGDVSKEGRVYFSFAANGNYKFYGNTTDFELTKLGEHFRILFNDYANAPEERARIEYTLGQLSNSENSPLKIHSFAIRTHGAPGAGRVNTKNFRDGAVVLFAEEEEFNSENASPPDENRKLPYLLPDGFSANVLLHSNFIVANLIVPKLKSDDSSVRLLDWKSMHDNTSNNIEYIATGKFKIAEMNYGKIGQDYVRFYAAAFDYSAPAKENTKEKLRIKHDKERLTIEWIGTTERKAHITWGWDGDAGLTAGTLSTRWSFEHIYKISVKVHDGKHKIELTREGGSETFNWEVSDKLDDALDEKNYLIREWIEDRLKENFDDFLFSVNKSFEGMTAEIEAFILSSLMFRNSEITLDSAHWPNDVTAIGQLAPDRNKFTITRSDNKPIDDGEISVLPGERITFKTEPATGGVTWSVRHLPNYDGDNPPGVINPSTGTYSAPTADKFKGSHIKVIISAQIGTSISHVLVSTLRDSLNIYPSIVSVNLAGYADIVAGEINGKDISMKVEGLGEIVESPDADPLAQATKRYLAPKQIPEWEEGMPEVDSVLWLDKVVVSSGTYTKTVHVLLPVTMEGNYWLKPKQGQAGVEFEFWVKPKNGPEKQVPKEQTSWHVRVGNGTIDDGVYTPHPSRPDGEYIVIVAMHEVPGVEIALYASTIVPIPFVSAEKFLALYASVEASDNLRRARINQK